MNDEKGGRLMLAALWLRCREGMVEDGRGGPAREGEISLETSSALPSIDRESLTWDLELDWLLD